VFEKIVIGKKVRSLKIFYFAEIWYDKCRHPILPYHLSYENKPTWEYQ